MRISFFEEFPVPKNLEKIKLLQKPTKIYLAAPSVRKFLEIKEIVKKQREGEKVKEIIYWPTLERKEGYWISPFSERKALQRIFQELNKSQKTQGKKIPVMLDLELPTTRNPFLYFTQSLFFFANKKLILSFIQNYAGEVYLAEYYPEEKKSEKILEILGLHFSPMKANKQIKIIKMLYHSSHHFSKHSMHAKMQRGMQEYGDDFLAGLGVLASGLGSEPLISPQQLYEDLACAQQTRVQEVILFRLGGLHRKYVKVLEKFV